jgi:microcin C transport system substrate-binding protein
MRSKPGALEITRRQALATGAALATTMSAPRAFANAFAGWSESHGLSLFGELALPVDFKHYAYVNPAAPKGGNITMQIKQAGGNQSFDTFNTLNSFVDKGDGAAGTNLIYDAMFTTHMDEPVTAYGLVAKSVAVAPDKLGYRFGLRPEARFHNGSPLTSADVVFSLNIMKAKGHPSYRLLMRELESVETDGPHGVVARFTPRRSRDIHMLVGSMSILPKYFWEPRDFEASILEALPGSGQYRMGKFEQGRYIEYERFADYWARDLPVNIGSGNFDTIRYEYFRDRNVAFEAFKAGIVTYNEEYTARTWATGYDFPAAKDGRIKREELPRTDPMSVQGWYLNTRRDKFKDKRIREALALAFDFEWTNKNIMFGLRRRTASFFQGSEREAKGLPSPQELALLEPFRTTLDPEVFGEPWLPPVSDGTGTDRNLLRRADELLKAAGCKREGAVLKLPAGKPFEIEFLDFSPALQPHTQPFQANLKRLGIEGKSRLVDATQYAQRTGEFDFDVASMNLGGSHVPGDSLKIVMGSESARTPRSRNFAGIADPAIDALITRVANATSMADINTACRALDRIFRAGRYWIPMWNAPTEWVAYWDMYERPDTNAKYGPTAPGTWWHNPVKAKAIGRG